MDVDDNTMNSEELQGQYALMGVCLMCHDLFRTDLSTANESEDFCCGRCEDRWQYLIEEN